MSWLRDLGQRRPAASVLCALALFLAVLPGCKQQDASLRVKVRGPFRMAVDTDKLVIDVLENRNTIVQQTFPLTAGTVWPTDLVLVQAGAAHRTVKINVTLAQSNRVVGRGTLDAVDFVDGKTIDVTLDVLPQ